MKLTMKEADQLLWVALRDCLVNPHLRLGQALWNITPKEVTDVHHGTKNDFFYWTNKTLVMQTFYKHYVEN